MQRLHTKLAARSRKRVERLRQILSIYGYSIRA
nr:MAG TPA: Protein mago nashi-like protein [Caudoviricetes sp.]